MGRVQNVWPTLVMLLFDVLSFWHFKFFFVRLQTLQLIFGTAKRLCTDCESVCKGVIWLIADAVTLIYLFILPLGHCQPSTANVTRCIMVSVTVPSWLPSTPPCPHTLTAVQQQSCGFTDCHWVNWVALNFSLNFKEACFSCPFIQNRSPQQMAMYCICDLSDQSYIITLHLRLFHIVKHTDI